MRKNLVPCNLNLCCVRTTWAGHVARMEMMRIVCGAFGRESIVKRSLGRPRRKWG